MIVVSFSDTLNNCIKDDLSPPVFKQGPGTQVVVAIEFAPSSQLPENLGLIGFNPGHVFLNEASDYMNTIPDRGSPSSRQHSAPSCQDLITASRVGTVVQIADYQLVESMQ
ncbi:hypothetical protein MMC12_003474 [Toensbergia leucococca]|nr:hypothetical protein [Toensbergia leucococca]